jgi:hypothetical protein
LGRSQGAVRRSYHRHDHRHVRPQFQEPHPQTGSAFPGRHRKGHSQRSPGHGLSWGVRPLPDGTYASDPGTEPLPDSSSKRIFVWIGQPPRSWRINDAGTQCCSCHFSGPEGWSSNLINVTMQYADGQDRNCTAVYSVRKPLQGKRQKIERNYDGAQCEELYTQTV